MPQALILSSCVAGSRVGGGAQALALALLGIDPVAVPTVLFGRHPGWGLPGGAATPDAIFEGMLQGIEAQGLFGLADLVITGYFASPAQVAAAARAVDDVVAAPREGAFSARPRIVVDPTLGDGGRLYVPPAVAAAVIEQLVARAEVLAPNAWELEYLTGRTVADPISAVEAARGLGRPVLASSIPVGEEIGVIYADAEQAWLAAHPPRAQAPKGTGDLLTALFAAALLGEVPVSRALPVAVGGVAETVASAQAWGADELPIVAMGKRLGQGSPEVRLERL